MQPNVCLDVATVSHTHICLQLRYHTYSTTHDISGHLVGAPPLFLCFLLTKRRVVFLHNIIFGICLATDSHHPPPQPNLNTVSLHHCSFYIFGGCQGRRMNSEDYQNHNIGRVLELTPSQSYSTVRSTVSVPPESKILKNEQFVNNSVPSTRNTCAIACSPIWSQVMCFVSGCCLTTTRSRWTFAPSFPSSRWCNFLRLTNSFLLFRREGQLFPQVASCCKDVKKGNTPVTPATLCVFFFFFCYWSSVFISCSSKWLAKSQRMIAFISARWARRLSQSTEGELCLIWITLTLTRKYSGTLQRSELLENLPCPVHSALIDPRGFVERSFDLGISADAGFYSWNKGPPSSSRQEQLLFLTAHL